MRDEIAPRRSQPGSSGEGARAAGSCGAVRTTCPYCGVGCGVLATPDPSGASAAIAGDDAHPANYGRLCSKGSALGETLSLDGRLLRPRCADGMGGWLNTSWEHALDRVAGAFSDAIAAHGPDSVAFYVSGQLLTEDYYVANKLMKGFIGSANIDTNSRLCMASSVAGHKRAFGADTVPGTYEDLEQADVIVLVGSNLAWCHPVLFQRIAAAKAARPSLRVVVVDPRRTATSELADLELRIAPGTDVALFNGLLARIAEADAVDDAYVAAHVDGLEQALAAARAAEPPARATGLAPSLFEEFARVWIGAEKVVTIYSQGVNQSSQGTDKVNAILNCHLATGRIGRPGMGPFSVTGQPNAMGGREVGGLANMLACHLELNDPGHRAAVQDFWRAPRMAETQGLKAVDLFDACLDGRIKALWIQSTNPAVSLPDADRVRAAIEACPFVVVSDILADTDTARLADLLLPAAAWGEKSGTVTNSERRISRQRPFLPAPGAARADWRIVADVAARMGWAEAFDYAGPADVFREYAALSGVAGALGRDFDISALAELTDAEYDALAPVQWPQPNGAERSRETRFFAEGGFFTPSRRANMLALTQAAADAPSADFPLRLNTGRIRDHWHTLTRTAKSARLSRHFAEPFLEIHPKDAEAVGLEAAELAEVDSPLGAAVVRVLVTDRTPQGSVFIPMHWTSAYASQGRVDALVRAAVDPISGQPDLKGAPVRVRRFPAAWHGFVVGTREVRPESAYWARAKIPGGWQAEIADLAPPQDWAAYAKTLLGAAEDAKVVEIQDPGRGLARVAVIEGDVVAGALFAAPRPVPVARAHVVAALGDGASAETLLAGRPGADRPDPGPTVCVCFEIGLNTIREAIATQGLADVEAIGEALGAGTNCGSCRPELRALLARDAARIAAE